MTLKSEHWALLSDLDDMEGRPYVMDLLAQACDRCSIKNQPCGGDPDESQCQALADLLDEKLAALPEATS